MNVSPCDVLVVGGGAAGLMAAIEAGKRGRKVVLLENADKVGKKILISGGGRCNFTNINARPETYLSSNPHFARSALSRYTPADFIALIEKHRVPYHEKKLGQLFCDDTSRRIVDLLLAEAREAGVTILTEQKVEEIEKPERFRIRATDRTWEAEAVIIATGGLSIPKMGATDFAHRLARRFELPMRPPRPGLVPLTLGPPDLQKLQTLSGVSIDVIVSTGPISFRENLLFTHRGLSGPAILQISSYWQPGGAIRINLLPDHKEEALVASLRGKTKVGNWLTQILPKRFAEAWLDGPLAEKPGAQCSGQEITNLISRLRAWEVCPDGTEGYAKAEVTVGGLDTSALSSKNMETRAIPGLYFIGEAVDVTGWLGGYNFQWAWASGWAAGTVA